MISNSGLYFYMLLFWGCYLREVIAEPEPENCCCDDKKSANIFDFPSERRDLRKKFNYTDTSENVFRKITNDSDIIRTAETLDKGYYTSLCWSELITLTERKNGTNIVTREYSIIFETKSDIPDKYIQADRIQTAPEYKEYEIYDQETKKSHIMNFTTISKSDDSIVRQSRKIFCGSGPVYTKEFIKWSQSDRNRLEIKVSPKKQKLFASNIVTSKPEISYDASNTYSNDAERPERNEAEKTTTRNHAFTGNTNAPSRVTHIYPLFDKHVQNLHTNFTAHSSIITSVNEPNNISNKTTVVQIPELIIATNPSNDNIIPQFGQSSIPAKGKVKKVTNNPNLADDSQKPVSNLETPLSNTNLFQINSTNVTPTDTSFSSNSDIVPDSSGTSQHSNDDTSLTASPLTSVEDAETTLDIETSLPNAVTTISTDFTTDQDGDVSDELGDIKKSTECTTTDSTEKQTAEITYVKTHGYQITTKAPTGYTSKEYDDAASANRIAYEDYQGPNDNASYEYDMNDSKQDKVRNSTEIVYPLNDLPITSFQSDTKRCESLKQKIVINVRISIEQVMQSDGPDDNFILPILGIEKNADFPIRSINEILKVPDETINFEWEKFLDDLGKHFFAINKNHIVKFTQLVSRTLNITSPESEPDYQILPEDTVKRLQGVKDYLNECETIKTEQNSNAGVIPKFRFSGELGRQKSLITLNQPGNGLYNFRSSPRYTSSRYYQTRPKENLAPYIKDRSRSSLDQLLKLSRSGKQTDLYNKMQFYYFTPQRELRTNRSWQRRAPVTYSLSDLPLLSTLTKNFRMQQESTSKMEEELDDCPDCADDEDLTRSLLSRLESLLGSKRDR